MRRQLVVALASIVVSVMAVGGASLVSGHIDALELKSYDFLLTVLRGPRPAPDDIAIVAIDESSMKEFASSLSWPWPRSVHAELIRQLNAAGARAIVFDVVFDVASDPEEDAELASAIHDSAAPVILAETTEQVDHDGFQLTERVRPLQMFRDAGARVGQSAIVPDVDGEIRRAPRQYDGADALASAATTALGIKPQDPSASDFLINFAGAGRTLRTASYYQAIDAAHSLPGDFFRGRTVFVGRSLSVQELAAGAAHQDLFATPFDPLFPGVEIHASAFNTLLHGPTIRRAPIVVTWAVIVLLGCGIAAAMLRIRSLRGKIVGAAAILLLIPIGSAVAFRFGNVWIYTVQPLLVGTGVFGLNLLYQYRTAERERALVRKALTGYVSKPVMQRLLDNPSALQLGGVQVEASVLFVDIVGFSSVAEKMTPADLAAMLNDYFTRIGDVIMADGGMIDKYIGDCIMAVWGAPLADPRHAVKASAAALAIHRIFAEEAGPLRARVGVNSGPMLAGNLGHRERMEYTVIGDAVNLASRLEGASKQYGTSILVSETTWAGARDEFVFRRVDRIRVVGKQQPVAVYELLGSMSDADASRRRARAEAFDRVLAAYDRGEWSMALDEVAAYRRDVDGTDSVLALYEERCRAFRLQPPVSGWDGVYSLTSK